MREVMGKMGVVLAVVAMAVQMSACATMFKGETEEVTVNSNPDGVDVFIDGEKRGTTPTVLFLQSDKTHELRFKKEGYEPATFRIGNTIGAHWVILDVLGFLVPLVVDSVTGAWYQLNEDAVYIDLQKASSKLMRELVAPGATDLLARQR